MCVGVSVWLGWVGIRVAGWSRLVLQPATRIPPQPSHTETPTQAQVVLQPATRIPPQPSHTGTPTQAQVVLQPATRIPPQPSHTETPTHIETRTHNQCGDSIEKSQAPDDGCINVRNMLLQPAKQLPPPTQPHQNPNTHRNKNTRPMWWFNRKVAGSWWWMY